MTSILLLFSLGILVVGYLPTLPPLHNIIAFFLALVLTSFFCVERKNFIIPLLAFTLGLTYGIFSGHQYLDQQLVNDRVAQDILVEGKVIDLPEEDSRRQQFIFAVAKAHLVGDSANILTPFPKKISLSSYGKLRVKAGEEWRLLVKLKKPRGFVNPGGFDYQVSLLRRGIGAVGYIRESALNQLARSQPPFSIIVLRYQLQQWLMQKSQSPHKNILIALLVGDTSLLEKQHWQELQQTGTTHLIAISGLHIGFFAIVGFLVGNFVGRFSQLLWHTCPSLLVGHFFAFFCATFYSVIAGLNIPTLRTLIMLAVVQCCLAWRRTFRGSDTLLLALVCVLLYDPLAAFDIGFWLSFGAVGMLIFCFSGRVKASQKKPNSAFAPHIKLPFSSAILLPGYFFEFIRSQWVMFVGLLIPLAMLVHTSPLLAPLANLVAIPLVTFFVVPCLIVAASCHLIFVAVGVGLESFFLHCAELGLLWLHLWLQYLLELGAGKLNPLINFNSTAIPLACVSVFLILLPPKLGNKWLGIAGVFIALLIPFKPLPALQMLVFDVGQGTAILLRTPQHQLLYDTGPWYTENFDAGSALIVPYLQSHGLQRLDTVVVSHNDKDHSGGLVGVLAKTRVETLLLGEPEKYKAALTSEKQLMMVSQFGKNPLSIDSCHQVEPWQWDQVRFRFLTWPINASAKSNNHSCVLLVEYLDHKILLTGDIEKDVEAVLLAQDSLAQVKVLVAPHHGSHTSSTQALVAQTQPDYVIYSAGYRNQFGHPHKVIQARYLAANAKPLNTAYSGSIEFNWSLGKLTSIHEYRYFSRRYWFDVNAE
ncbi:MAG: DNA internalization-related competence protein ComEC/Rec2 [Pseudomonadota bacterium]